ncbi:iron complex transport system ATP-binding protein [Sinorhizobium terangae]|uniref:ATP-binding cassette domain-containing protein n=1 Tax=Sinorhizobium terangae TaxID=110322 RepID=A0A6N7LIQ8_SINTE|nr:ABC transporter ATP-binding protein [Sinorhizobium terangae]MBB4188980.1 iron complex transport system ATP-binding protein [Sinorhizobium terangae]MQX16755.1 ATP-binding cassette domain-containing protein [Sinorhizobium terangae]
MIRFANAGVRFGARWIFRGLDLSVASGTTLALLGPNGRGKTTLIRSIVGLIPLSEGNRNAPSLIGYVPQATGEPVRYTVLDMVVMGRARQLGVFGSPSGEDYRAAHQALSTVGLEDLSERPYNRTSGGERQLIMLARALSTGACTIVLDEPASALDLANQSRLLGILRELQSDGAYTIVFSTHLPQHALHLADETMMMMPSGRIIRSQSAKILSEPNLEELYGVPIRRVPMSGNADAIVPLLDSPKPVLPAGCCRGDRNHAY